MAELDKDTLGENWRDVVLFTYEGQQYKRNSKVRDFFNSTFSASLQAVYTEVDVNHDVKNGLDWSGEQIIFVNAQGVVNYMSNSEWASIDKI